MTTVLSNNVNISYRIDGKGKAIVFLHGVGRNHTSWKHFYNHFEELGYTTITPDLRGCGYSKTAMISMKDYADDIKMILDKEKIKKATLVGHCLGASIAIKFYEQYPKRVDKLALLGIFSKQTIRFYHIIRLLNHSLYYSFLALDRLSLRRKNFRYIDYSKYQDEPLWLFPFIDFQGIPIYNWLKSVKVLLDYDPDLKIKAPYIAIFAGKDHFVKSNDIKNSKVIKELDHVMVLRKPKILFQTLEEFIDG